MIEAQPVMVGPLLFLQAIGCFNATLTGLPAHAATSYMAGKDSEHISESSSIEGNVAEGLSQGE
jgi:hypothetical protein